MDIEKRILNLRARCEEQFYMLSAVISRKEATKLAPDVVRSMIQAEIAVHEDFIKTSENFIKLRKDTLKSYDDNVFQKKKFERGFETGAITVLEGRIISHKKAIEDLNVDLKILKLNFL